MGMRSKKPDVEQVKEILAELDDNIAWLIRRLDDRFEDVNQRLNFIKASGFERLEDCENKLRLLEMNVRAIRRTLYRDNG